MTRASETGITLSGSTATQPKTATVIRGDAEKLALPRTAAESTGRIKVGAVKIAGLRQRSQCTKTRLSAYRHATDDPANMTNKLKVATRGVRTNGSDPCYPRPDIRSRQLFEIPPFRTSLGSGAPVPVSHAPGYS